jgi:hypothetical protein
VETIRQFFDVLVVCTALFVILRILTSNLIVRAAKNPFITIVMGFMLTTIGWLAWNGLQLLFQGYSVFSISPTLLGILGLVTLIIIASFFQTQHIMRLLAVLLIGAWVFLAGVLAIIGLSKVDLYYIEQYLTTWVFLSLIVALVLQIVLRYITRGMRPQQPPPTEGDGHEPRQPPGPPV